MTLLVVVRFRYSLPNFEWRIKENDKRTIKKIVAEWIKIFQKDIEQHEEQQTDIKKNLSSTPPTPQNTNKG